MSKMLSRQQKAIIRKTAKLQEESFMRIVTEGKLKELYNDLIEEGYDVKMADLEARVAHDLEKWDKVKEDPDGFLHILDDLNLGMVRHILVNEFRNTEHVANLHRKLNLFEELSKYQN